MPDLVRLSKFLALTLRHRAAGFGLTLDENGLTALGSLWALVEYHFYGEYSRSNLEQVVTGDGDGKKRYEIVGEKIRAMYGHTKGREVRYPPAEPPVVLYHGTSAQALHAICANGLKPIKRQYVHLTTNSHRAIKVGTRHDQPPVLLIIHAWEAHAAGILFYHPEAEHWLTKQIPVKFIECPHLG